MSRLARRWTSLSFADQVNGVILVLTCLSIIVAIIALRVAQVTLQEANAAASDQKSQFEQQSRDSEAQFNKQMSETEQQFKQQILELKQADETLQKSKNLLKKQSDILGKLQDTSDAQLGYLAAEYRRASSESSAQPIYMTVNCTDGQILYFRDGDTNPKYEVQELDLYENVQEQHCWIEVQNLGMRSLSNAKLEVTVSGSLDNPGEKVSIAQGSRGLTDGFVMNPEISSITLFAGLSIAPVTVTSNPTAKDFTLHFSQNQTLLDFEVEFTSDNTRKIFEPRHIQLHWKKQERN